jgi:multiple sugar transport system substrate-binding protein
MKRSFGEGRLLVWEDSMETGLMTARLDRRRLMQMGGATLAAMALPLRLRAQEAVELTVWSWLPDLQSQIDMFTVANPNVTVKLVNAGQGGAQYTALRAGLEAGSGLPDVVQIEFQMLESFRVADALADIGAAANAKKGEFPASLWSQVSDGDAVYAMPQDSGPMAMLYRDDVFAKHGITPPASWDEFAAAARALHAADPEVFLTNGSFNDGGWINGMLWQAGWQPVRRDGTNLTIAINDDVARKFVALWEPLLAEGVIEAKPAFTNEWYAALDSGRYATWLTAGWGPVFLTSVAKGSSGKWRAADLPQWAGTPFTSGNWGGSTLAVLKTSPHQEAAAALAVFLCADPAATELYTTKQFLFPTRTALLQSAAWAAQPFEFYGGQAVNEVFAKAAGAVPEFEWSPFQDFLYQAMSDEVGAWLNGTGTMMDAFDRLQETVVRFAQDQGFTVV